ncbi:unnamed protein product [Spirodela intermedia]|uniref:Uncharacterized protein n=1 Tax=Spirodela intermedia TaxID=51605 RepID=A0A7I8JNI8_SPIIN|nr:unnamed protein product [Spirodela intermedia]CAA6671728.1 unnamed protein product [Spirodela intermedia]
MELPLLLLHPLLLFSQLLLVTSDVPTHGCYWTETCQSKWVGGCGAGHLLVDQSNECGGLCPESKYPPCLPFHTHCYCCIPESPTVTDRCMKCRNKLDFGDEYLCCTDCSEPFLIDTSSKLGYCKTGAKLSVQLKPQEKFRWVVGTWMKCSSPCDGGIRYRDVDCFGSMEDTSIRHFAVDDSKCSGQDMPARQEPCNVHSCEPLSDSSSYASESDGLSGWLVAVLVLLGLVAVGGLGFAGFTFYQRRNSSPSGFVYIMMEGYS